MTETICPVSHDTSLSMALQPPCIFGGHLSGIEKDGITTSFKDKGSSALLKPYVLCTLTAAFDMFVMQTRITRATGTHLPKVVIMFTGYDWAKDFLEYLNKGQAPTCIEQLKWDKYECCVYLIDGTYFMVTRHPPRKKRRSTCRMYYKFNKQKNNNA